MFKDYSKLSTKIKSKYGSLYKAAADFDMSYDSLISSLRGRRSLRPNEVKILCERLSIPIKDTEPSVGRKRPS